MFLLGNEGHEHGVGSVGVREKLGRGTGVGSDDGVGWAGRVTFAGERYGVEDGSGVEQFDVFPTVERVFEDREGFRRVR